MRETKMQTLQRHLDYCKKLCESENVPIQEVTEIKLNYKSVSRWGLCTRIAPDKFEIEISERLLDSVESLNGLDNTILHELIHTCDGCFNHGPLWKKYAARFEKHGFHITRCNSAEEKGVTVDESQYKWKVVCNVCGTESFYTRKTQTVSALLKNPHVCTCRKCKGKDFSVKEICAKAKAKAEEPTSPTDYIARREGKKLKGSNMISKARQQQMIDQGYMIKTVDSFETAQEAYDRLSMSYTTVRIYSQTTKVRGYYSRYAMVKK